MIFRDKNKLGDLEKSKPFLHRLSMTDVFSVARYILKHSGPMTAMKLHKLVYYSQAWSLVWDEKPLFKSRIEAWANGPVVPALYEMHKGRFELRESHISKGDCRTLTAEQRETIDKVLEYYGSRSATWLSDLTHKEAPWKNARGNLSPSERGNNVITQAAMAEYYGSL